MINKKVLLIIILAAIAAGITAFCIFNLFQKPVKEEQTIPSIEQEEIIQPQPAEEQSAVNEPETKQPEPKPAQTAVKKVTYTKPAAVTINQGLPQVKEPEQKEENIIETNLKQEENTTDVIIPIEYKMKSPSKYSFK